jgi:hypothetical protein
LDVAGWTCCQPLVAVAIEGGDLSNSNECGLVSHADRFPDLETPPAGVTVRGLGRDATSKNFSPSP